MIQYFQIYDFIITSETVLISDEKIYKLYFNIYRMIVRKTKFLPSTVCDIDCNKLLPTFDADTYL